MKKILLILIIIMLVSLVYAQEEAPKYNFGSMQTTKELNIAPGETAITKLYFYNIYGNRITHIDLSIGEAPKNWDITFEPALHEAKIKVSGVVTTVEENLYVEPSEAVKEIPEGIPEGIEYISSSVGYIGAKPVKVKITVPENEKLGKVANIRIDGTASWLGQTGTAALTQGRSFDYSINVISKEFTEEVGPELEKPKVKEKAEELKVEEQPKEKPISEVIETTKEIVKEEGISPAMFYTTVIVLVIIILILLIFFIKGKKKKEKK